MPTSRDENVLRLHVAVDDTFVVSRLQRIRDLASDLQCLGQR
jgi:hypothetical protein